MCTYWQAHSSTLMYCLEPFVADTTNGGAKQVEQVASYLYTALPDLLAQTQRNNLISGVLWAGLPPGMLYVFGLTVAWIRRGFQASPPR